MLLHSNLTTLLFREHNMWICFTLHERFPFSLPVDCLVRQRRSWEEEGWGGGGGGPLSSPLLTPSTTTTTNSPLNPRCTGMAWERIPHPIARRHPATKYNTNSIKCSLRCDLPQWMINWSSFSHCRISESAIIGRIVM